MKSKQITKHITIIFSTILFVVLILLHQFLKFNYANFNGEYVKSSSSPHVFNITDICLEKKALLINAKVINNTIHVIYYLYDQNCLKLARSDSLVPKSSKDWHTSIVINEFFSDDEVKLYLEHNLTFDASELLNQNKLDYRYVNGKPSISFVTDKTNNKVPYNYFLNILIGKTEYPSNTNDWKSFKHKVSDFNINFPVSFGYYKDQYVFLGIENILNPISQHYQDDIVLFTFSTNKNQWSKSIVLKNNPNNLQYIESALIDDPEHLYILYFQRDVDNRKDPFEYRLRSLISNDFAKDAKWLDTLIAINNYRYISNLFPDSCVYNRNSGLVYTLLKKKSGLNLIKYKIKDGQPHDIFEQPLIGVVNHTLNTQPGGLQNIAVCRSFTLVNEKPVYTSTSMGNFLRYDFESKLIPNKASISNIDIFQKLLSNPSGDIFPIGINNGLSYVYYQANLGKLRFAREVDPTDVPRNRLKQLQIFLK